MGRKVYEASVPCCKDVVIIAAHQSGSVKARNRNTAGETFGMTGAGFVQAAVSSILTRSIMLN